MCSTVLLIFLVLLFFITITEAGKHVDKIIIHVPYKILKHHHTHTKYKILTIHHNPKKENTITYYKAPVNQHPEPKFLLDMDMKDSELKGFILPDQMSETLPILGLDTKEPLDLKGQDISGKNPIELHAHRNEIPHKVFTSSFTLKPIISQHLQGELTPMALHKPTISIQHNHIPQFSFKPLMLPTPSHEASIPKFPFRPITHTPHDIFNPVMLPHKLAFKPSPGKLSDNIPHTSSHIYNTIISPRAPKKFISYAVKKASQEGSQVQATFARNPKVSLSKPKNFRHNLFEINDEPEYEHVGYLIINGDERKIVGKDKHALRSWG